MEFESKITINRENKDRLFNFIFGREENKKWTLELYNAVNKSDYKDESQIEFNTLDNFLYVSMRNDTSFIFSGSMSLYEHQSTYNPNIPLRFLQYVSQLYEKYINENELNKYGSKLVKLPVPKLVVFYNGTKELADETILKLSDSFDDDIRDKTDIEVVVRMYNINFGHSNDLMKACKPLYEYSGFVSRIRNNGMNMVDAVTNAITEMPDDYVLKPFLSKHMSEVTNMLQMEYQEKQAKDLIARASRREGKEEGLVEGRVEGIKGAVEIMKTLGLDEATIITKLCEQYGLTENDAKKYFG